VSTELSITVTNPKLNGGKPTNIPSIWNGQRYNPETEEDAIVEQALASGQTFASFETIEEAVAAAEARSNSLSTGAPSYMVSFVDPVYGWRVATDEQGQPIRLNFVPDAADVQLEIDSRQRERDDVLMREFLIEYDRAKAHSALTGIPIPEELQ